MRKQMAVKLEYGEHQRELLKRINRYLAEVRIELNQGRPLRLPDIGPVIDSVLPPWSGITRARSTGADRFKLGWDFVAATFAQRPNAKEGSERYFDPLYFVVLLLMTLAGGAFRHKRTKDIPGEPERWLLEYGGVGPIGTPHQVLRTINNPRPGREVRQNAHPTAPKSESHYDLRRLTLYALSKPVIRKAGQLTRTKGLRTQDDAITRATGLFQEQLDLNGTNMLLDMDAQAYERLLRDALGIADNVYSATLTEKGLPPDWNEWPRNVRVEFWRKQRG